jgi:hypothetical protein
MNTHLAINAEATLDSHRHDWQPIDGWRARYRCRDCGVIGRKRGAVTIIGPWELRDVMEPPEPVAGGAEVTPYACTLKCAGLRCGCPAVKKTGSRRWRCSAHLALRRRMTDDPFFGLPRDGEEDPAERSSAA